MNTELKAICIEAGCPDEVLDTLWFNIFIQKFAHLLLLAAEEECGG